MTLWERAFLGNTLQSWLIALLVTLGALASLWILVRVVLRRLATFARKTRTDVDDLVAGVGVTTRFPLLAMLAVYAGSLPLALPEVLSTWLRVVAWIAFLIQVAIWGDALISFWLNSYQEEHVEEDADRVTTVRALSVVGRLCLYSIVVLLALDNIPGIEVTALIGSLGITGIAVALAVQNILGDLFASLSIALDKPFVIGDLIVVGDDSGSVEHIGLKTTRIRSLSGEQLIVGNSDLLGSRIRNHGRMGDRRVVFSIGVAAETPNEKLKQIPSMIREIIESQQQVRFGRTHFRAFGDFSLNFQVVYYVLEPNYDLYMDIQQAINLAILRRFAEEGIQLPYPTQTVYIGKEG
jgi:small-conductance mechanosensitive channel